MSQQRSPELQLRPSTANKEIFKNNMQNYNAQFNSVAQSCLTPCDPMNHSTPGLPVHHQTPRDHINPYPLSR